MHSPLILVFVAVLFFLLTPGVLVRLPPKCTLLTCAAFHAVVFTVVFYFGCKLIKNYLSGKEGYDDSNDDNKKSKEETFVPVPIRR